MLRDKASESIQELHNSRILRYADATGLPFEKAVVRLMHMHQRKVNISEHISKTIGDNHMDYIDTLRLLGEYPYFIR